MDWVLRSPAIHSLFGNLGFAHNDGYRVNKNCNAALETILENILAEDKYLRPYRRSVGFGQNISRDLIPLLLNAKDNKTIEMLVKIFVNLTVPIECLLSVEVMSKSDSGRNILFEIEHLLTSAKSAFSDQRVTKIVIEFLKRNIGMENKELTEEQCTNISNGLLLLRNILHVPEESANPVGYSHHETQNQILWNLFSQSVEKILIKLMVVPEAPNWGVSMIQLIAVMYKDQHTATLQKLINNWLETLSESSEDNESNTSPPNRGMNSDDSSPMLTSDPTSDSSETGKSGKSNEEPTSETNGWTESSVINAMESNQHFELPQPAPEQQHQNQDEIKKSDVDDKSSENNDIQTEDTPPNGKNENTQTAIISIDEMNRQGSVSTSSNEDLRELPSKKPVHQKPHNLKRKKRAHTEVRTTTPTLHDNKRKKLVKRAKSTITNVQGLSHKTPSDNDISNILKDFTVDFLLKGYNNLVQTLYTHLMTSPLVELDISHFFWLISYFSKFVIQIELGLKHVRSVLSYDVISYVTAEGVNLCEQLELAAKLEGCDLRPSLRRLHLVVTSIREFVQLIEVYKKCSPMGNEDQEALNSLQVKICETEELRSLLLLLLHRYNSKYHTKKYLQDLVITNHNLLIFLESAMKLPGYNGSSNMNEVVTQFATPEIMYRYGMVLVDYQSNGEFVNDSVFTMMHHVAGDMGCLDYLFQPTILKTFSSIMNSEFEICDDWNDLIQSAINTVLKKQHTLQRLADGKKPLPLNKIHTKPEDRQMDIMEISGNIKSNWTTDELSTLSWTFMQCSGSPDVVGEIVRRFNEDGIVKSRDAVISELKKLNLTIKNDKKTAHKGHSKRNSKISQKDSMKKEDDEINRLCKKLKLNRKSKFLSWVQQVLLEICYTKIYLEKKTAEGSEAPHYKGVKLLTFEMFKKKAIDFPAVSPVAYHSLVNKRSVPLVPWSSWQAALVADPACVRLLHALRLHLPRDTHHLFVRVPHFWTAHYLYEIASKLGPIDTAKLKFSLSDITSKNTWESSQVDSSYMTDVVSEPDLNKSMFYQIHSQKQVAVTNFTPKPGSSLPTGRKEVNVQSWLKLVQMSQECKMSQTMKSVIIRMDEDKEMGASLTSEELVSPAAAPSSVLDDQPKPEPDCDNSLCETASVTSDRMYVSDEDDKSDVDEAEEMLLPSEQDQAMPDQDQAMPDQNQAILDQDQDYNMLPVLPDCDYIAKKRPRLQ